MFGASRKSQSDEKRHFSAQNGERKNGLFSLQFSEYREFGPAEGHVLLDLPRVSQGVKPRWLLRAQKNPTAATNV